MKKGFMTVYEAAAKAMMVICALFLCNIDVYSITVWGLKLLDCAACGKFRQYAVILLEAGQTTNYTVLTNLMTAVWFLPLYLIQKLSGTEFSAYVYMSWYKILIFIACLLLLRVFERLAKKLFDDAQGLRLGRLLFMLSPAFILAIVGGGQVDSVGALFLLLSFEAMMEENDRKMIVFAALSVCVKGQAILIIVPWLILMWTAGNEKRVMKIGAGIAGGLLGQYLISDLLFIDYNACVALVNRETFNMQGRIYKNQIGDLNLFLLAFFLICILCFLLARSGRVERRHFYLLPMAVMTAMVAFVDWNPQYLVYMVPFFILMGMQTGNKSEYLICRLMFAVGYVISIPVTDPAYYDSSGMLNNTFVRLLVGRDYKGPFLEDYITKAYPPAAALGLSLMVAALIGMLAIYALHETGKLKTGEDATRLRAVLTGLQLVPILLFLVASTVLYIVNV